MERSLDWQISIQDTSKAAYQEGNKAKSNETKGLRDTQNKAGMIIACSIGFVNAAVTDVRRRRKFLADVLIKVCALVVAKLTGFTESSTIRLVRIQIAFSTAESALAPIRDSMGRRFAARRRGCEFLLKWLKRFPRDFLQAF